MISKKARLLTIALSSLPILAFANDLYYPTIPVFKQTDTGKLLVGKDGLALYTFKKDVNSPIPPKCTSKMDKGALGSCLARWPAATIEQSQMKNLIAQNPMYGAVFNNELNKLQLTYGGLPVYYWYLDNVNNNFTGDGVGHAWSLIIEGKPAVMFNGLNHEK